MCWFEVDNVFMKSQIISLYLLITLFSSVSASAAEPLNIINPWIAEAPPGASVMAGYMEIQNTSHKKIDILSISSDAFSSIEMHRSIESDGFAKMLPQKKLSIGANEKLILQSGSYHLMLIKPAKWFKHGEKVKLNFMLSNNKTQSVEISIKKNKIPTMKCAAGKCGAQ